MNNILSVCLNKEDCPWPLFPEVASRRLNRCRGCHGISVQTIRASESQSGTKFEAVALRLHRLLPTCTAKRSAIVTSTLNAYTIQSIFHSCQKVWKIPSALKLPGLRPVPMLAESACGPPGLGHLAQAVIRANCSTAMPSGAVCLPCEGFAAGDPPYQPIIGSPPLGRLSCRSCRFLDHNQLRGLALHLVRVRGASTGLQLERQQVHPPG